LLGRVNTSGGGGGEVAIDLDTDFGPDLQNKIWSLSFEGQIASSVGFSGWTGFSVGNPANTPDSTGTGFGFILLADGTYEIWNNGSNTASGTLGLNITAKLYSLGATFDEVANTVQLSYSDATTSVDMGTYSTAFVDGIRFVELKNHVDSSAGDGIVDMRWDNLAIQYSGGITEVAFYTKWAEDNELVSTNSLRSADPDEDGMDNLSEYALGGNPNLDDAVVIRPAFRFNADGLIYVYNRRRDAFARGLVYDLVYKFDLLDLTWISSSNLFEVVSSPIDLSFESVTNQLLITGVDQGSLNPRITEQ